MPLGSLTGPLGKKRAGHLLRRACFGASIEDINTFAALTAEEAFDQLLQEDLPDPALPIDPKTGSEWVTTGRTDANSEEFELMNYLNSWIIGQSMAPDVPEAQKLSYAFRERIVFFLHTLLTTKQSVVNSSRAIYFQNALFRLYAFDHNDREVANPEGDLTVAVNLKELTKKISVDNAMLVFLDGRLNVKGSPNENYARELLELYTIGRGLEGNVPEPEFDGDYYYYTEADVQAGAKVLSGFTNDDTFSNIDPETGLPRGIVKGGTIASSHDNSTKQFSQRLANASVAPNPELMEGSQPTEESALDEISQLIDVIYSQEQTPIHLCRRLYRFFVYHEVTEAIQEDVIREMADIFVANDFKIIPVLRALFLSSYFYEGEAGYENDSFGGLIKSPFDLTVSFYKTLGYPIPSYSASMAAFYDITGALLSSMNQQGLDFYEPYEVAGYQAYHQYPIYNRSWITTNYLTNRYSYINDRIAYGSSLQAGQVDIFVFVKSAIQDNIARDAESLIIALAEYLLPMNEGLSFNDPDTGELTGERLSYFMNAFLYNPQIDMDPESSWTYRWDHNEDTEVMSGQLVSLVNALMQSPEYQLM